MKCIKCNSEVAEGMQFCPYCGSLIVPQQQPQQPSQGQYQQPPQGQYQQPQQGQYQQPQQGQYQQPQQGQYQQPQQGQYQQPQQGQYQQPYQGQYQQPQQGQYQQPYQGQYQQPQQGQYQQPQQGQYQQPYQGQYQQPFAQQKPQLPHRPQLTFMEAINLASHRLTEIEGRSRRSEYWWWYLAIGLGSLVLGFIPFVGNFVYIAQFCLLYAITIRRLHDCSAPELLVKMFPSMFAVSSICMAIFGFYSDDPYGLARDIILLVGDGYGFYGLFAASGIVSLIVLIYSIKDSNPDIDPMHGPSPKYTL